MLCRSICVKSYDTFTNSAYISEQASLEQVLVITERPLLVKMRFFPSYSMYQGMIFKVTHLYPVLNFVDTLKG